MWGDGGLTLSLFLGGLGRECPLKGTFKASAIGIGIAS